MLTLTKEAAEPATTSLWNFNTTHTVPHKTTTDSMHTSFYWGSKCQLLFPGWPGSNRSMYVLALFFVFSLAVLVEWLSRFTDDNVKPGGDKIANGFFRAGLYAIRTGFSYMVMLSVMSFNGGVFIVAVVGHAFGYAIFRGRAFRKSGQIGGN